jgi:hypothetical protein
MYVDWVKLTRDIHFVCTPSYQARFQMHWDSKILLINPPEERPPLFYDHFFTADEVALQEGNAVLILAKFMYVDWVKLTRDIHFVCTNDDSVIINPRMSSFSPDNKF